MLPAEQINYLLNTRYRLHERTPLLRRQIGSLLSADVPFAYFDQQQASDEHPLSWINGGDGGAASRVLTLSKDEIKQVISNLRPDIDDLDDNMLYALQYLEMRGDEVVYGYKCGSVNLGSRLSILDQLADRLHDHVRPIVKNGGAASLWMITENVFSTRQQGENKFIDMISQPGGASANKRQNLLGYTHRQHWCVVDNSPSGAHGAGRTNENFRILNAVAMRRAHEEYLIQFINMAAGFG